MYPNRANNFCCGAGGGAWASPYVEERIFYGRVKAKQIKDTGAKLLIAPCHNCRDQIMKSLRKEYDFMDVEVKYLWELVADSLIIEPREVESEEEE
jgi:Fe-S oxidoreductase